MSLQRRIQFMVLGSVLAAFLVAGTVISFVARNQFVGRIDQRIVETAETIAGAGELLGTDEIVATLDRLTMVNEHTDATAILDPTGEVLWVEASGMPGDRDPLPDLGSIEVDELRGRAGKPFSADSPDGSVRYRVVTEPLGDGVLLVATPLDDVRDAITNLVVTMLVAAGAVVVVVAAVTTLASRRVVKPVDDMVAVAEAIGEGDLSHRIPAVGIGEVERLGDALNNMLGQLEAAFEAQEASEERLRRFVADASHELRTPLTSIRGYAELYLGEVATDTESVDKAMRRIRSEAVRTSDMVNDLLVLARLDKGPPRDAGPVNLSRVVADSVADLMAVQPDRSVELDIRPNVIVQGSEDQLRQVVANLLTNTRVHAEDASVRVRLSHRATEALLVVSDDGPGMDPEQVERVFDRFWQASESRSRDDGGVGLGLSIVQTVVRSHGGRVEVTSEAGAGTSVSVALPLNRPPEAASTDGEGAIVRSPDPAASDHRG